MKAIKRISNFIKAILAKFAPLIDKCSRDNISAIAGQSAFFIILSSVPLTAFVVSLLQTFRISVDFIIREISEETGIWIDKSCLIPFKIYDDPLRIAKYPDGNILRVITVVFIVKLSQYPDLICSEESVDLNFFAKNEISKLDIAKTHIQIIDDYLNESGFDNKGFKIT